MVDLDVVFEAIFQPIIHLLGWQFSFADITWTVGEWLFACCLFGCVLWFLRWLADVNNER